MQNNKIRKPYLSVHVQPLMEKRQRKKQEMYKNVKVSNIHDPKIKRSYSSPHSLRFPTRFEFLCRYNTSHTDVLQKKEDEKIIRRREYLRKESLNNKSDGKQSRRSCDCLECGCRTIFQRSSMNATILISQHIKEKEAQANKFQRSQKKQIDRIIPQYLNCGNVEEVDCTKFDFVIDSFEHLEPSQPATNREKIRVSFFDNFLQKQQQLIIDQRRKFSNHRKLLENKMNFRSIPILPYELPKILTPRTPATIATQFPSPQKRKSNVQMYFQPPKSKQHNRLLTHPELQQHYT